MNNLSSHNISLNDKFICSKSVVNLPYEIRANIKMKNLKKKLNKAQETARTLKFVKLITLK